MKPVRKIRTIETTRTRQLNARQKVRKVVDAQNKRDAYNRDIQMTANNDLSEKEWLEDSKTGRFSRVAVGLEDSTWVCNTCGHDGADPWEYGCENCGEEADRY